MKSTTQPIKFSTTPDYAIGLTCVFPFVAYFILTATGQLEGWGIVDLVRWTPREYWQAAITILVPTTAIGHTWLALKSRPEMRNSPEFYLRLVIISITMLWALLCLQDFSRYLSYGDAYPGFKFIGK